MRIQALTYSTNDKRHNRPNPSKIPIDGDICNNLASYRDAVKRYRKFRDDVLEMAWARLLQKEYKPVAR